MLESMLSGGGSGGGAFGALQKLLKSGIPGLENLFGQNADGSLKFNKMSDEDKKRFIEAVTGGVEHRTVVPDSDIQLTLDLFCNKDTAFLPCTVSLWHNGA